MKKYITIITLVLLSISVNAAKVSALNMDSDIGVVGSTKADFPHTVRGWVYDSVGVAINTDVIDTNVIIYNDITGVYRRILPGDFVVPGYYSYSDVPANDGDPGHSYAYNDTHWGNTTFTFQGGPTTANVYLNNVFPNRAPELDLIGNRETDENVLLSIQLSATDLDHDSLTYGIVETLPSSYSFDTANGLFEWTPTYDDSGIYTVTFNVTDGEYTDNETIQITVNNVNQPPNVPSNPNPTDTESDVLITTSLSWVGGDLDLDSITYDLYFSTNPSPAILVQDLTELTYDVGTLDFSSTYYWKIVASDGIDTTEGPVWSFTTESPYGFILNLQDFPMYEAQTPYNENTGSAVLQMTLDYIWWNSSETALPQIKYDQTYLYDFADDYSSSIPYLDTFSMLTSLQNLRPPYITHGYNFGITHNTDLDYMINTICKWMGYSVTRAPDGFVNHVPAIIPAYGDYSNWMSVRGIHTDVNPYPLPETLTVYGFWINDPYPASLGGIGENSYKTIEQFYTNYFQVLSTSDSYNGEYVSLNEPPVTKDNTNLIMAKSPDRFGLDKSLAILPETEINPSTRIIQAAISGVSEQLIPIDDNFASVFENTMPGTPMFVKSSNGDYYLVPFNNELGTVIVVVVDAEDGSFKEASWTKRPMNYLPITQREAIKLVLRLNPVEIKQIDGLIEPIELIESAELIHRSSSPYYPEWKVKVGTKYYYVSQDGDVTPKPKVLPIVYEEQVDITV